MVKTKMKGKSLKVDTPLSQDSAEVLIQASPQKVYEIVSNLERMGEWSPECYHCEWLDKAENAVVGARFKGWNRVGLVRWSTTCRIIAAEPGRELAWEVIEPFGRVTTRWRYRLETSDDGCRLVESIEVLYTHFTIKLVQLLLMGGHRRRMASVQKRMQQTLERIKVTVEA